MKQIYINAGIPTARQSKVTTLEAARAFIEEVGYPVVVKPDNGVGAANTWKLSSDLELERFFGDLPQIPYVMEEFIEGDLVSYEAILDSKGDPLFENMSVFPIPVMDAVNDDLNLTYYVSPVVDPKLSEAGRRTVKAFGVNRRFVHLEFFRLKKTKKGLGKKGEYAGLEVNMRPPGGYTPDMINFAHSTDVYQIFADMVLYDELRTEVANKNGYYCVYYGRKDGRDYLHSHEEIMERYRDNIVMQEEMPPVNWPQMGRYMYTARFKTKKEMLAFVDFMQE